MPVLLTRKRPRKENNIYIMNSIQEKDNKIKQNEMMIPGLYEMEILAKYVKKQALIMWNKADIQSIIKILLYAEMMEARIRSIRLYYCLQHKNKQKLNESNPLKYIPSIHYTINNNHTFKSNIQKNKIKKKVAFITEPIILGRADPLIDRRPVQCSIPSVLERLLLRAERIFPQEENRFGRIILS